MPRFAVRIEETSEMQLVYFTAVYRVNLVLPSISWLWLVDPFGLAQSARLRQRRCVMRSLSIHTHTLSLYSLHHSLCCASRLVHLSTASSTRISLQGLTTTLANKDT